MRISVPGKEMIGESVRIGPKIYVKARSYDAEKDVTHCVLRVSKAREIMRRVGFDPGLVEDPKPEA